jgi:glycosyltransferase involved in cell wall biosynthesis
MNVLLINCDWRNLFQKNPHELWEKLERDRLCPDTNNFFIFSFAKESCVDTYKNWKTVHQKTRFSWFKPFFDILSCFSVTRALEKENFKPDVVITYDFGFLPAARKVQKKYGSKIVMVINNMPRLYSATRKLGFIKSFYSWFLEKCFKRIPNEYFTINDAMKTYLLDLGIPNSKIHMFAMDTINRDRKFLEQSTKGNIRPKYNIPETAKVLICVARLEAEKGYERLLPLFATLPKDHYLIILGEGSLRKKLEHMAEELGIKDRVKMPGFVLRNKIWDYYNDSNAFVLLSKAEALGVVVWEAMYMKLPVLGSTAAGIVESTGERNERGFILKDDEGEIEFKEKIQKCIDDSKEKSEILERAFNYVDEKIKNKLTLNDIV